MSKESFALLLSSKVQEICIKIVNYFGISYDEAIEKLYNSKLYEVLDNEESKMWYFSSYDLFKMFLEERETGEFTV